MVMSRHKCINYSDGKQMFQLQQSNHLQCQCCKKYKFKFILIAFINRFIIKPSNIKSHSCGSKFLVKRSDDNEKIILKRYETYVKKTLPILKHYERLNLLHEIEGKTGIDQIFGKIRLIIASLEA